MNQKPSNTVHPVNNHDSQSFSMPDKPLNLSVHGIPQAGPASLQQGATGKGRLKLLLLLLVCTAPVLASYFTYYVLRPEGRRNFGELITPQRPLPSLATQGLAGEPGLLTALKGQWLLVAVSGGACNSGCENNLYLQRQLRESLGREKERMDRVWLINDAAAVPTALRPAIAAATVLRVPPEALIQWLQPQNGQSLESHLYLIDPLGNWMMRFPASMDAAGASKAKRDLDRLLRASNSWDREGRS